MLLQGGNEKKIRLFDLGRPDAEPLILGSRPDGLSCDGTIRSLVWDDAQGGAVGVSASEDGLVRCVAELARPDEVQLICLLDGGIYELCRRLLAWI